MPSSLFPTLFEFPPLYVSSPPHRFRLSSLIGPIAQRIEWALAFPIYWDGLLFPNDYPSAMILIVFVIPCFLDLCWIHSYILSTLLDQTRSFWGYRPHLLIKGRESSRSPGTCVESTYHWFPQTISYPNNIYRIRNPNLILLNLLRSRLLCHFLLELNRLFVMIILWQ